MKYQITLIEITSSPLWHRQSHVIIQTRINIRKLIQYQSRFFCVEFLLEPGVLEPTLLIGVETHPSLIYEKYGIVIGLDFFKIDEPALREYSLELGTEITKTEAEIYELAGLQFNLNSPKQLGEVLFDKLKIPQSFTKKTKTGQYSTSESILTNIAESVDLAEELRQVPEKLLHFRQLSKLKSTYVDALPALVNPNTGRIHTTYSQAVTATGRLSSNNPNLQNIPIRRAEGRAIA